MRLSRGWRLDKVIIFSSWESKWYFSFETWEDIFFQCLITKFLQSGQVLFGLQLTRLAHAAVSKDNTFENPRANAARLWLANGHGRWWDYFTARGVAEIICSLFSFFFTVGTNDDWRHFDGKFEGTENLTNLFTIWWRWNLDLVCFLYNFWQRFVEEFDEKIASNFEGQNGAAKKIFGDDF